MGRRPNRFRGGPEKARCERRRVRFRAGTGRVLCRRVSLAYNRTGRGAAGGLRTGRKQNWTGRRRRRRRRAGLRLWVGHFVLRLPRCYFGKVGGARYIRWAPARLRLLGRYFGTAEAGAGARNIGWPVAWSLRVTVPHASLQG
eukprot:scaffold20741_cov99-Isochrysis_galbana.AAC.4